MYVVYKLIALSVVFGLVLANPVAKTTDPRFDDLTYDGAFSEIIEDEAASEAVVVVDKGRTAEGIVVPKLRFIDIIGGVVTILLKIFKVIGLKIKAITCIAKFIKWIAPKTVILAIGAISTFAFCKVTDLCNLSYTPVVAELVPPEVRGMVTPERIQDAQQLLTSALQLYMKDGSH